MYKIRAEQVIANYFAEVFPLSELSLEVLSLVKQKTEEKYAGEGVSLFIDNTFDCVYDAVASNPNYFYFNESRSVINFRSQNINEFYMDVYSIFNSKYEREFDKYKFVEILNQIFAGLGLKETV